MKIHQWHGENDYVAWGLVEASYVRYAKTDKGGSWSSSSVAEENYGQFSRKEIALKETPKVPKYQQHLDGGKKSKLKKNKKIKQ